MGERVMEDIVSRLRALNFMGPWSEAADEIERLRNNQSIIITSFRINMMRLCPEYSHEEFDKDIAAMLKEKE
jgi:hypothetical protein